MPNPRVPLLPRRAHTNKLALFAEVLYESYIEPQHRAWSENLARYAIEFDFNHINIHGAPFLKFIELRDYPAISKSLEEEIIAERARFREILEKYKQNGIQVTLGSGGVQMPENLFAQYPEARNINSGLLAEIIESMVVEYFEAIPEADALEIFFWEAMLVNDGHLICPEMYWGGEDKLTRFDSYPYYSPEDFLADLINAYGRGAERAGKQLNILTFSHFRWQEELLIGALKRVDRSLPIVLDHKCQPGDWTPKRLTNNVLEAFPAWSAQMLFDGAGEYWGQCRIPYCYPEEVAHRLQHALDMNPSIQEVGMRVMWAFDSVFGNFNEINLFALKKLAGDPFTDLGEIWDEWTRLRFGDGAQIARRALIRTGEICNRIFYIEGAWVFNHSEISSLTYLESHLVNFAKAMIEWNADDFTLKGRLREVLLAPGAYTLDWVLGSREEALRLAELSLCEVRSAQALFPIDEYAKLVYQLELLVDVCRMAYIHMEQFMRYWITKIRPDAAPADQPERFHEACAQMLALADAFDARYGDREPMITARKMREYVQDVTHAFYDAAGTSGSTHNDG